MKKLVMLLALLFITVNTVSAATVIKKKGMDQGTLVQAIYVLQTQVNDSNGHQTDIDGWAATVDYAGLIQTNGALLGNPQFAKGTDTLSLKIQKEFDFVVDGTYYTKEVADNECDFSTMADLVAATGRFNAYSVSIGTDGTCYVDAGAPQATAIDNEAQGFPVPSGEILLANVRIGAVGSDHSFTLEELDADGLEFVSLKLNSNNLAPLVPNAFGSIGQGTEDDPQAVITE